MSKQRYSADEVIAALEQADGLVTGAARLLGCHPNTVHNYVNRYSTVADARDRTRESTIDEVESHLLRAIREGNVTAMIFYLKTQAKHRGYVEREERDNTGEVVVKVSYADADD